MGKIKLLIICESLAHGGNERWVYEISRAINKDRFEVSVLCGEKYAKGVHDESFANYYYPKLEELKVQICPLIPTPPRPNTVSYLLYRAKRLARHLGGKSKTSFSEALIGAIKAADVVCVIDFYNYASVKELLHRFSDKRFFIVLHSHKAQFNYDPYVWFNKDRIYDFTYFCPKQVEEIGSSGLDLSTNKFFFNPLVLDLSSFPDIFNQPVDEKYIFSIFTRITPTKPIEMFIKAFSVIERTSQKQVYLNVYGEIQDVEYFKKLQQLVADLGISRDRVQFKGHSIDMALSISNDKVNLYWGLGINESCGYSSIEIGAMAIPSLFWNLDNDSDYRQILENTKGAMLVHNDIKDFVQSNLQLLENPENLANLSALQKGFFRERHDIKRRIANLEEYIASFAKDISEQI